MAKRKLTKGITASLIFSVVFIAIPLILVKYMTLNDFWEGVMQNLFVVGLVASVLTFGYYFFKVKIKVG